MWPAYFFSLKYSKSRQTGSGHATDSKMRYTIQFSILMLCAKYHEAGLSCSREKCDRNYLVIKFAYVHNIQSCVKQEVDMPQIQKCVTRYSSPYWCSVPNITKLASVVPEKNVTEIFCDADIDDARWQKWSLYVASAKAGRRHNKEDILSRYDHCTKSVNFKVKGQKILSRQFTFVQRPVIRHWP